LNWKTLDSFNVDCLPLAFELTREVEDLSRELAFTPRGNASARVAAPPASKAYFRNFLLLVDLSVVMRLALATPLIS